MSYYCYSFDIKIIKSINEYLFILKNCLRLASKNNVYKNFFNKRIHVKYCEKSKDFFYQINSSLKKVFFKQNNCIFKNTDIIPVLELLKLKVYTNRAIEFELDKEGKIYPIALYNSDTKKLILAYKDLYYYFNNNSNINFLSLNLQINIKNYQTEYSSYLNYIKKINILDKNLENYLDLKLKNSDIRISYAEFDKIFKTCGKPLNKHLFYYIIFVLSIEFNRFFNKKYFFSNESFCIYDKNLNKIIKFPFCFYDKQYEVLDKEILPPLLPVSF